MVPDDNATGTDMMHHQYKVAITPKAEDGDLIVKVNEFEDQVKGRKPVGTSPPDTVGAGSLTTLQTR